MLKEMVMEIFGGAWPMIVIFSVILSSIRITYLIVKKEKFVFYKELTYLLFVIYLLSLFYIVTFQDDNFGESNWIPFKEIFRYDIKSKLFFRNIIGNVLLFMPFGFFVAACIDSSKVYPIVILTFISSLSVEIVQKIIGRVFDVDDIILNVLGGILGAVVYIIVDKIRDNFPNPFNKEWFKNLLFIILLIIAVLYFTNVTDVINRMVV